MHNYLSSSHQLEEIFRKKKDRKEVAEDAQRFDQQVWLAFKCRLLKLLLLIFYVLSMEQMKLHDLKGISGNYEPLSICCLVLGR